MLSAARRLLRPRSYDQARLRLLKTLPKDSVGCEVGVWRGDFSARIIDTVRPRELHLVDPWLFIPEYGDSWYGGAEAKSQQDMDDIYAAVVERFALHPSVRLHRCASAEAVATLEDESLDWVYIDGCHLYDYVLADLEAFSTKVRPGGILCGDDYGSVGWWDDGVRKAVDEFVATRDSFTPVSLGEQFVLRKG